MLEADVNKNLVIFSPDGKHDPNSAELQNASKKIFIFLDNLKNK